jgi:hypothetical protein
MGTRGMMQVHGEVSRAPARWVAVVVPQGVLQDVLYEKAAGEQIAKVRADALQTLSGWLRMLRLPRPKTHCLTLWALLLLG